jgi:hypothetical protein
MERGTADEGRLHHLRSASRIIAVTAAVISAINAMSTIAAMQMSRFKYVLSRLATALRGRPSSGVVSSFEKRIPAIGMGVQPLPHHRRSAKTINGHTAPADTMNNATAMYAFNPGIAQSNTAAGVHQIAIIITARAAIFRGAICDVTVCSLMP